MTGGYMGKLGFIDLTTGNIRIEPLDETLCRDYIGGYGFGVRILYEQQKRGVDPLGPENILGLATGPLTGTKTPTGARYMAVTKSPLTGGWGDANSGGYFGSALKAAGFDALFFTGQSPVPKYLLVTDDGLEIQDASHLWGKDAIETEEALGRTHGDSRIRVACIGPASERLSLISGIVNDKGRVAARSGVGAVMGSKGLKAVVVRGSGKVPVADAEELDRVRRSFSEGLRQARGFPEALMKYGTCGATGGLVAHGATPVKNWLKAGEKSFPGVEGITDGDRLLQYQERGRLQDFRRPLSHQRTPQAGI
jgi:aldehyde:ferredoxin oxidoreductase